ncbi:MAG TPA: hypothetical protein VF652_11815 [Allosphingosinicella sp.]|jgi:hypothetical protein
MQIQFDIDVDADDEAKLREMFDVNAAGLPGRLAEHGKAALSEYLECYLGRRAFSRGSDILEHRLSLLVKHAFAGRIPTAAEISDLFQTTLTTSRTLIRNTFSKYRFELDAVAAAAAKDVLERVVWADGDVCNAKIAAPNLVELLNRRLLSANPGHKEIVRTQGAVGTYAITQDAYAELCALFGAQPVAVPNP